MLGKIFRPRRSTTTPSPEFETGPTRAQPTAPKSPPKLLTKLKQLKKVIPLNLLTKKKRNAKDLHSNNGNCTLPSPKEALADLAPNAVLALDHEYKGTPPTHRHQSLSTISPSIANIPRTASPTTNMPRPPPSNFPSNYHSASLAPVHHVSPSHQQPAPISYVGTEVFAAKSCLAELETINRDPCHDGEEEIKIRLSTLPQRVVIHTSPTIQSYTAEIYPCQPAEDLVPAANAFPKIKTAEAKEQNGRRDPSRGFQQAKRHCKNAVIDWNERRAQYRNAGVQNHLQPGVAQPALARPSALNVATDTPYSPRVQEKTYPLAEQACGLRRNGGIQRKEQPHQHLKRSTFSSVAQGQNQPFMSSNDGGSSLPDSVAHAARRTSREPLQPLDQNAGLDETRQAGADDDSEDANSSYGHSNQAPALEPSFWLGQGFF